MAGQLSPTASTPLGSGAPGLVTRVRECMRAVENGVEGVGRGEGGALLVACVDEEALAGLTPALGHSRRQLPATRLRIAGCRVEVADLLLRGEVDVAFC